MDADIEAVCLKMLARDRVARFASMTEVAGALRQARARGVATHVFIDDALHHSKHRPSNGLRPVSSS
jgi:hypothetical protein